MGQVMGDRLRVAVVGTGGWAAQHARILSRRRDVDLVGSYDSSYAYPDTQLVEVNGTSGRVLIEDTVRRLTVSRAGDASRTVWEAGYFDDEARTFEYTFDRHIDALLAAFRAGEEPPVHARAGRRALEVAHAIIRLFETRTRVAVCRGGAIARRVAQPSIDSHMRGKSGMVLAVVPTFSTSTPGTASPTIAANVAIRWS